MSWHFVPEIVVNLLKKRKKKKALQANKHANCPFSLFLMGLKVHTVYSKDVFVALSLAQSLYFSRWYQVMRVNPQIMATALKLIGDAPKISGVSGPFTMSSTALLRLHVCIHSKASKFTLDLWNNGATTQSQLKVHPLAFSDPSTISHAVQGMKPIHLCESKHHPPMKTVMLTWDCVVKLSCGICWGKSTTE